MPRAINRSEILTRTRNPSNCVYIKPSRDYNSIIRSKKAFVPSLLLSNVMSLAPKIDEVRHFVEHANLDIICLTETWLQGHIQDNIVSISGFNLVRLDRKTSLHGGTTKRIFRISSIFPCLLGMAISFAQAIDKFSCDFEDPTSCKWTQDSSDDFDWTRHQGYTSSDNTGPTTDHTKGVAPLANKNQGPGFIKHRGGQCIHVLGGGFYRPKDGTSLVLCQTCGESRMEFQLWPNGTLMHTRHGMCVKPATDGVRVGVFSRCDATDKWSWTAQGSLQYKKKMCLKLETGGSYPRTNIKLVLDSACNEPQNFFEFVPANKYQGPGSIKHWGGQCIHVLGGGFYRPKDGTSLVLGQTCGESRMEFQLWPNGTLMHTRYCMCVKPATDGVRVGVFSSCSVTDKWSWTAQGSLQYKKKMCLKPETGGSNPRTIIKLVLDSACNEPQNFFEFVPTSGWYLYIEASFPRQLNDAARFISPWTTEAKSCLFFFYYMYGLDVGKLQVYVKSGGKMGLPVWNCSGNHGEKWYQAQVPVNNQTASYQYVIEGVRVKGIKGDIAIDDISLRHSCTAGEIQPSKPTSVDNNGSKKVTTIFTVSTTPAILPSQTIYWSEENQPSKPASVDNNGSKKVTTTFTVSTTPAILPFQTTCCSEDKGTTDDSSRVIMIATAVGAGIFLCIVLIVLLIRYKRRKLAPKLSTPVSIPLMVATPQESLPIGQEPFYETVATVDQGFYDDVATNANESEDISTEGRASLYDWVEEPSNADKTSEYKTPVENEHQEPGNETVARVDREFYNDVATNANESEDISAEEWMKWTQGVSLKNPPKQGEPKEFTFDVIYDWKLPKRFFESALYFPVYLAWLFHSPKQLTNSRATLKILTVANGLKISVMNSIGPDITVIQPHTTLVHTTRMWKPSKDRSLYLFNVTTEYPRKPALFGRVKPW